MLLSYQFLIGYISNVFIMVLSGLGVLYQFLIGYISNTASTSADNMTLSYQFLIGYISNIFWQRCNSAILEVSIPYRIYF